MQSSWNLPLGQWSSSRHQQCFGISGYLQPGLEPGTGPLPQLGAMPQPQPRHLWCWLSGGASQCKQLRAPGVELFARDLEAYEDRGEAHLPLQTGNQSVVEAAGTVRVHQCHDGTRHTTVLDTGCCSHRPLLFSADLQPDFSSVQEKGDEICNADSCAGPQELHRSSREHICRLQANRRLISCYLPGGEEKLEKG